MKKALKILSVLALIIAVLMLINTAYYADGESEDPSGEPEQQEILTGWQVLDGNKYFYDSRGVMATLWQDITDSEGKTFRYYFGDDGIMRTNWQTIDGKRYFFKSNGVMLTGWQNITNREGRTFRFYFDENGVSKTGWQTVGGKRYFFKSNGVMLTGWQNITNREGRTFRFYFDENGVSKTGFQKLKRGDGKLYYHYFGDNGVMRTGFQKIKRGDGKVYYHYFGDNGCMRTGFQKIKRGDGKVYYHYFGDNGCMRTGWQSIRRGDGKTYNHFFKSNGVMVCGFYNANGKTYYFRNDGRYYCSWVTNDAVYSQQQINAAAEKYSMQTDSRAYLSLMRINYKYSGALSASSKSGTLLFFMEGAGKTDDISVRKYALGVLVRNREIIYINNCCSTIPDCPFSPSRNYGQAMPTLKSGIYNFTTTYHSSATTQCAGLNVNGAKVVRHNNKTDYYSSTSSSINIHRRNRDFVAKTADEQISSAGCIVIGNSGKKSTDEYARYSAILGITNPGDSGTASVKNYVSGKVIVDRGFAKDYLKKIGYSDGAINLIG